MARTIVGEVFLNVKPVDAGVTPGIQRIIDTAETNAAEVPVDVETEQAQQAVGQLSAQIEDDLGGAWLIATAQAAAFTGAVIGIRRSVEGLVNQLAGVFDQLAQAQAGFTAILGSEQAGGQLLDDIREFARVSPFVTQELVNYSQQLLGVGQSAESIVPLLSSVGDVIASVGGDTQNISRVLFTLTQIRSIGRLVGQDAIQLQSSLIPITKLLADFLDVTTEEVKKLQEQGAITADTVFAAIQAAGEDVAGAMATATRNISGARAVLSDTVEIMIQDSAALRRVFDDIVAGILAFSDALGEPEIQNNINSIFESFDRIYTSLEPLLEGFGGAAGAAAISSLELLASTLEVLAGAIELIPVEALDLIGKSLAVLLALKAPVALLNYGRSLQQLAVAIRPLNLAQSAAGIPRLNQNIGRNAAVAATATANTQALAAQTQRLGLAFGGAAVLGGLLLDSVADNNDALQQLAGTLQGGGIGASIGAAFGPQGALAGAAIGAGVSLITGFVTSARQEAERQAAEIRAIGQEAATEFLEGFRLTNPLGFTAETGFEDFFEQLGELEELEARFQEIGDAANAAGEELASIDPNLNTERFSQLSETIAELRDEYNSLEGTLNTTRATIDETLADPEVSDALSQISALLAQINKDAPEFGESIQDALTARGLAVATGQSAIETAEDFESLQEALRITGLTIDDLIDLPLDQLLIILNDEVPDALKETRTELSNLNKLFDESKTSVEEFFSVFSNNIEGAKIFQEQSEALSRGFQEIAAGGSGLAFAESLLDSVERIAASTQAVFENAGFGDATERGLNAGLSFAVQQFEALRRELGLAEGDFQEFLDQIGLLDLYLSSINNNSDGFFGTLQGLAVSTGLDTDQLRELLNLSEEIADTATLSVSGQAEQLLDQISFLQSRFEAMPSLDGQLQLQQTIDLLVEIVGLAGAVRTSVGAAQDSVFNASIRAREDGARVARETEIAQGRQALADRLAAEEERRQAEIERELREVERAAQEQQRELEAIEREHEAYLASIENASRTLGNAVESAASSIEAAAEAWTASISERITPERAIPIERLIRNAGEQASALEFINDGLRRLEQRGLSADAIEALGIDNVSDFRQVERLLAADPNRLRELSGLVSQRDDNAEAIARRQQRAETQETIVAAILQAAAILDVGLTRGQAEGIAATFNINGQSTAANVPESALEALLNAAQIERS